MGANARPISGSQARRCCELAETEALPVPAIAERLGLSYAQVRGALKRAGIPTAGNGSRDRIIAPPSVRGRGLARKLA